MIPAYVVIVIMIYALAISVPSFALERNGIIEMPFTENPPAIDGRWTTKDEWTDAGIVPHEIWLGVKGLKTNGVNNLAAHEMGHSIGLGDTIDNNDEKE